MNVVHERCCGLDVHKETVVACLLIRQEGKAQKDIRTFLTMTSDLVVLGDWLRAYGVTHVAMESTGVYWKPIYNLLEGEFEVLLVNATHLKTVPGRKTDVRDCEWIADLLSHGLLRGSFIPPEPIRDLRDLTRYRRSLTDERVREINRLQKLLETANIKLASVASDVLGVSGRAMLEALLGGSTNPEVLADLARGTLRQKLPQLRKALEGRFRPPHRFLLGQILAHLDFLDESIAAVSEEVTLRLRPFSSQVELLKTIPGIEQRVAETVLSEIGVDMTRFGTARHLASWAGVCPGNNQSAGKRKSGKVRKGDRWLKRVLLEAAWGASRSKETYLRALYARMARRRGLKKGALAVAHSLLVIIFHILSSQAPYRDLGPNYFDRLNVISLKAQFVKRLEGLGYKVSLEQIPAATSL